jgi:predicted negative regulator of RcsB-dependent stress response
MKTRSLSLALTALLATAGAGLAQLPPLNTPQASPAATVSQVVGLTDISIDYHRPAVNKRTVWGDLVPYGQTWRAGANENTTIEFSSPVTIGGKKVPAGKYGLHMLPTDKDWSVMLSSTSTAWGSFSYDEKEDVVRFPVTPKPADFEERLEYRFENPTDNSVDVVMQWEKLAVSFPITVDTNAVVMESLQKQLRGLSRVGWQAWNQAAQWALQHDVALPQATEWADHSIGMQKTFANLRTKAAILEKQGDAKGAEDLRAQAMKLATEVDVNALAYQLLGQKKTDEAIALFRKNVKDYPNSWNVYDSLGEGLAAKGDTKAAVENYNKAMSMTTDPVQKKRIQDILAKMKA